MSRQKTDHPSRYVLLPYSHKQLGKEHKLNLVSASDDVQVVVQAPYFLGKLKKIHLAQDRRPVAGSCEHGNEPSSPRKSKQSDRLSYY
jgi:hypothetical protein